MRFYICQDSDEQVFDCFTKMAEARMIVKAAGGGSIAVVDVDVTADTVKKLLGNLGGYAKSVKQVKVSA